MSDQPNGNVHGCGPNSQFKAFGPVAGYNCRVEQWPTDYVAEGYWSVSGYVVSSGEPVERKWSSISTHLTAGYDVSFQTVMRLNSAGIDAQGNRGDDLWLHGWSHHGAAFFWPYSEATNPGYRRLHVGGPVKIESGEHGNDAMLRLNNKNPGKTGMAFQDNGVGAGGFGLEGWATGSASGNIVFLADQGRELKFYVNGGTLALRVATDGRLFDRNGVQIGT